MIRAVLALVLATALVAAQPQTGATTGGGGDAAAKEGGAQRQQGKGATGDKMGAGAGGERGGARGRHFMPLWDLPADQLRFRERPDMRGSVATATNLLLKSGLAHEPMSASVFFTPDSVLTYKNGLANSGVYKGYSGLFDFGARSKLMFHTTAFNYSIPFVDEARGVSIVKLQYAGKFIRSGKTLESTATCYIRWRLGKVQSIHLVDDEPLAVWNAFATPAELIVGQFYERLFSCGECAAELLANDIKVTARITPKLLADRLSYQGIEEFKKRAKDDNFGLALKQVHDINFLYGDDNTVVVKYKFGVGSIAENIALSGIGANPQSLPGAHGTSVSALSDLKGIAIVRVKDGKIASCVGQLSQPLMPWQVAHVVASLPENKGKPFGRMTAGGHAVKGVAAGDDKAQQKGAGAGAGAGGERGGEQAKGAGAERGGEQKTEAKGTATGGGEQKPAQQQKGAGAGAGTGEREGEQRKPLKVDAESERFFG